MARNDSLSPSTNLAALAMEEERRANDIAEKALSEASEANRLARNANKIAIVALIIAIASAIFTAWLSR